MISAGEWPEEGHRQARDILSALEHGPTLGIFPFACFAIEATIENADGTVVPQSVRCGDVGKAALEAVIEARDLEPLAKIPVYGERTYGHDAFWFANATAESNRRHENARQAASGTRIPRFCGAPN